MSRLPALLSRLPCTRPTRPPPELEPPHPQGVLGWPCGDAPKHQRQHGAAGQVHQHVRRGLRPRGCLYNPFTSPVGLEMFVKSSKKNSAATENYLTVRENLL